MHFLNFFAYFLQKISAKILQALLLSGFKTELHELDNRGLCCFVSLTLYTNNRVSIVLLLQVSHHFSSRNT